MPWPWYQRCEIKLRLEGAIFKKSPPSKQALSSILRKCSFTRNIFPNNNPCLLPKSEYTILPSHSSKKNSLLQYLIDMMTFFDAKCGVSQIITNSYNPHVTDYSYTTQYHIKSHLIVPTFRRNSSTDSFKSDFLCIIWTSDLFTKSPQWTPTTSVHLAI